jgi:hypothetical protein
MHTNEKIKQFVDIYIYCNVSLSPNPLPNAQQHQHVYVHVRRKIMLFVNFITHLPPMFETKNPQSFEKNENYPFSKQYLHT